MMKEIKKFSKQYGGLLKSYNKMSSVLGKTSELHARYEQNLEEENDHNCQLNNEETGVIKNQFDSCQNLFDKQITEIEEIYGKQYNLLYNHFKHQGEVINESVKPFLGKIAAADKKYDASLTKFCNVREM